MLISSRVLSCAFLASIFATGAIAEDGQLKIASDLPGELGQLAVVVLVVESALSAIFQWRVYRMVFNNRAMKTVVMVAVGALIVYFFKYDVFSRIMAAAGGTAPVREGAGILSGLISALVIAGGSSGMNVLLQRLGFRNPIQAEPEKPKLNDNQAWLSVKIARSGGSAPLQVGVRELDEASTNAPLAGTLVQTDFWTRLREAFEADTMRFPNYGGYTVRCDKIYEISIIDPSRLEIPDPMIVYKGKFVPKAIVDFRVRI